MQKKIVAAICAAALALAMPAAAFAKSLDLATSGPANSVATLTADEVDGDNAKMLDIEIEGKAGYVTGADIEATSATASNYVAYTNDVMKQSWTIDAGTYKNNEWKGNITGVDFTVAFKQKKIDQLPTTIAQDNLYTRVYVQHGDGGTQYFEAQKGTSYPVHMTRLSTVTAVLGNGPLSYGQPVGANNVDDLNKAAADGSKSPKTGELA